MYASVFGAPSTVKLLLDMGASIRDYSRTFDLLFSIPGKFKHIEAWLQAPFPKHTLLDRLLRAVKLKDREVIWFCLGVCSRECSEDYLEHRVLSLVIQAHDYRLFQDLVISGLSYEAVGADDENLLFGAVRAGNFSGVEELLTKGLDINSRNSRGEHALFVAAQHRLLGVASYLVSERADLNLQSYDGLTVKDIIHASFLAGDLVLKQKFRTDWAKCAGIEPQTLIFKVPNQFTLFYTRETAWYYAVLGSKRLL